METLKTLVSDVLRWLRKKKKVRNGLNIFAINLILSCIVLDYYFLSPDITAFARLFTYNFFIGSTLLRKISVKEKEKNEKLVFFSGQNLSMLKLSTLSTVE